MQSESKEKMEQGIKNGFSVYNNDNTQKPTMVKYFYFDKDGRQLSEEDVQKLKINVKGNVVLSSGLAGAPIDGNFLDSQGNSFENGTRKTTPQQTSVIKTEPVRQRSVIPNFQASHNGQIYLVTPDGGLRPAEESSEIKTEPDDQEKKNTTEKVMPGTNIEYRNRGTNHLNRNGKIKRPMNAFMLWAREFRGRLAEQMPNASNAEISVGLGQVWANLPTPEKQHFYLEAERVKNQHRRDFPGWIYQPNITKRQNSKDSQHARMWQRFVTNKEADGKEQGMETKFRPIAPAPPDSQSSGNISTKAYSTGTDDDKLSPPKSSVKIGDSQMSSEVKSNTMTLDEQKHQQDSKIDAQTIQSTVKQVIVSSSSQQRVYNHPLPVSTFKEFKQDVMSSEQLKNTATCVHNGPQLQTGIRKNVAPIMSTHTKPAPVSRSHMMYRDPVAMAATGTQVDYTRGFSKQPIPVPGYQTARPGRPSSYGLKYDYTPLSKISSFVPMTRPRVSSTVVTPSTGQVNQQHPQKLLTQETLGAHLPVNQTMLNQFAPHQGNETQQKTKQAVHQMTANESHSPDDLQQPIAIPTLPNLPDKADPLWPFPFPGVEQGPQTHLLYQGSIPETHTKSVLSDPYAPFYFDNYINPVRPTELQVDVNGWQQYLNDDHTNAPIKQTASYFPTVKQCPSDIEICPSPASHTLSRNQIKPTSSGTELSTSTSSDRLINTSNTAVLQEVNTNKQHGSSPSSIEKLSCPSTSQESMLSENLEKQNQMVVIQTTGNNQRVAEENEIHITPLQTPSGHHIGTMVQNFGNNEVSINPVHYGGENMYQCIPQPAPGACPRSQGKGVEFGSIMSSAFHAINGDLETFENNLEKYPLPGYNETVSCVYPQHDVPQYVQPSTSSENFQMISKYQDENNRPIKKRSYKIIEGLLENEVWMTQNRPMKAVSATEQSFSDLEFKDDAKASKSDDELLRKGKITKDQEQVQGMEEEEDNTNAQEPMVERNDMIHCHINELLETNSETETNNTNIHEQKNSTAANEDNNESPPIRKEVDLQKFDQEKKGDNSGEDTVEENNQENESVDEFLSGNNDETEVSKVNTETVTCEENFENKSPEIVVKTEADDETDKGTSGYSEVAESKEELSKIELVIDNAEVMSPSNCEEQYLISNDTSAEISGEMENQLHQLSKPQLSEILEDESSSEIDKQNTSESNHQYEEIFKSVQLVKKNKTKYTILDSEKSCVETKHHLDYPNLESGDATASVKRVALEEEEPLPSFVKSRNKRRQPYDSPVRASKRLRN